MKFPPRSNRGSDNGTFLKLKDGESVTGVFRGELYTFYCKWTGTRSEIVPPNDPDGKERFRLNMVVKEGEKFVAKIWEFPGAVCDQLSDINAEYPLSETKIKITRRGTGKDTVYMILPLLKEKIPVKMMKEIEAVPLNILEHKEKPQNSDKLPWSGDDNEYTEDHAPEVPF